jgi:hypothetical protein
VAFCQQSYLYYLFLIQGEGREEREGRNRKKKARKERGERGDKGRKGGEKKGRKFNLTKNSCMNLGH